MKRALWIRYRQMKVPLFSPFLCLFLWKYLKVCHIKKVWNVFFLIVPNFVSVHPCEICKWVCRAQLMDIEDLWNIIKALFFLQFGRSVLFGSSQQNISTHNLLKWFINAVLQCIMHHLEFSRFSQFIDLINLLHTK